MERPRPDIVIDDRWKDARHPFPFPAIGPFRRGTSMALLAAAAILGPACRTTPSHQNAESPHADLPAASSPVIAMEKQKSTASASIAMGSDAVSILCTLSDDMFSQELRGGDIDARATAVSPETCDRASKAIRIGLSKYPTRVLNENLQAVYVVGDLAFYGIHALGTNNLNRVYIVDRGPTVDKDASIETRLHHEFSSILLRNFHDRFPQDAWSALNPTGFQYLGSGVLAVKQGKSGNKGTPELLMSGFVNEYAQSSLENDFNIIAQLMFCNSQPLRQWAGHSAALRGKIDLVIEFYHSLDPMFTREYFQSLSTSD